MKPHQVEYWLNAKADDPEKFVEEVAAVCELYQQAKQLHEQGTQLLSVDEKTGIQALERAAESLAMKSGWVEKVEYEYVRHGTQCLMANLEVATGEVVTPTVGASHTEEDFVAHLTRTIAADREAEWISSPINSTPINRKGWCAGSPESVGLKKSWEKRGNQECSKRCPAEPSF